MKSIVVILLLVPSVASAAPDSPQPSAGKKPNIVYILADNEHAA